MRLLHGFDELLGQDRALHDLVVIAFPMQLQPDVGHLVKAATCRQSEGAFQSRYVGVHRENVAPKLEGANKLRC